jgi:UDP-N-acetylmuramate dehydrogenase
MAKHTSLGIGGNAGAFIRPESRNDLQTLLTIAAINKIDISVVGSGSNLLVADSGFDGIVITLAKVLKEIRFNDLTCYAESGVMLGHLVMECKRNQLSGLESLVGIPGTLGGALIMNAGAFGGEISNLLLKIEVIDRSGKIRVVDAQDIQFDYRSSSFDSDDIILSALFKLHRLESTEILEKQQHSSALRKKTQPLKHRSAGSVFKNPKPDLAAGYLIDKAGLKGLTMGDAEISKKHANFFINNGYATADDIVALIKIAKDKVKKQFNVDLELELKLLGFEKGNIE